MPKNVINVKFFFHIQSTATSCQFFQKKLDLRIFDSVNKLPSFFKLNLYIKLTSQYLLEQ